MANFLLVDSNGKITKGWSDNFRASRNIFKLVTRSTLIVAYVSYCTKMAIYIHDNIVSVRAMTDFDITHFKQQPSSFLVL